MRVVLLKRVRRFWSSDCKSVVYELFVFKIFVVFVLSVGLWIVLWIFLLEFLSMEFGNVKFLIIFLGDILCIVKFEKLYCFGIILINGLGF